MQKQPICQNISLIGKEISHFRKMVGGKNKHFPPKYIPLPLIVVVVGVVLVKADGVRPPDHWDKRSSSFSFYIYGSVRILCHTIGGEGEV